MTVEKKSNNGVSRHQITNNPQSAEDSSEQVSIYQKILDSMSDGVMTIGAQGKIMTLNKAAAKILHVKREEALNKVFAEIFLLQEGFDDFNQAIIDAIYQSSTIQKRTVTLTQSSGDIKLALTTSFLEDPDNLEDGNSAAIAVFSDITNIEELRQSERALGEELQLNHHKLQEAYSELEQSNSNLQSLLKKVQSIRILAVVLIFFLFTGAGYYLWGSFRSIFTEEDSLSHSRAFQKPGESCATLTIAPQLLSSTITLPGKFVPKESFPVTAPFSASIEAISFQYGDVVNQDDVLLAMNTDDLLLKLRETQAAHIKILDKLQELKHWKDNREVARSKRSMTKARNELASQKNKLKQTSALYKRGIVSSVEFENEKTSYRNAQMNLTAAQEEFDFVLRKGDTKYIDIVRLQESNIKQKFDLLERQLSMAEVKAPVTGTVIRPGGAMASDKKIDSINRGTSVSKGQALVTIAGKETIAVRTLVDEIEILKIHKGQEVSISSDVFPEKTFTGEVSHVSTQIDKSNKQKSVFEVLVTVKKIDESSKNTIFFGMSALLDFVIYKKENALLVPLSAVQTDMSVPFILLKEGDDSFRKVTVKTGITTVDSVEILEGIQAGDVIWLNKLIK